MSATTEWPGALTLRTVVPGIVARISLSRSMLGDTCNCVIVQLIKGRYPTGGVMATVVAIPGDRQPINPAGDEVWVGDASIDLRVGEADRLHAWLESLQPELRQQVARPQDATAHQEAAA